jgi:hypothetical protein
MSVIILCGVLSYGQDSEPWPRWTRFERQMRIYALDCISRLRPAEDDGFFNSGIYVCVVERVEGSYGQFEGVVSISTSFMEDSYAGRIVNNARSHFNYYYKRGTDPAYGESWDTGGWYYRATIHLSYVNLHFSEKSLFRFSKDLLDLRETLGLLEEHL